MNSSKLYRSALFLFLLAVTSFPFGAWNSGVVQAQEADPEVVATGGKMYLPLVMNPFSPPPVVNPGVPNTKSWPGGLSDVTYTQSGQHMLVYDPNPTSPVPLLVGLHTWSRDYRDHDGLNLDVQATPVFNAPYAQWAIANQWVFINPNFRGPNSTGNILSMGSDVAVQDIVDAVNYAIGHYKVDVHRIYLVGSSGGGHMALLMAARHPEIWAGVSAWAGISDLPEWWTESAYLNTKYVTQIQNICGLTNPGVLNESNCLPRSSVYYFPGKASVIPPLDINAGIEDGHLNVPCPNCLSSGNKMYAVPIRHSLKAFNLVAAPWDQLSDAQINTLVGSTGSDYSMVGSIPRELAVLGPWPDDGYDHAYVDSGTYDVVQMDKHVLFRRQSGKVRLTIFNGNHEILYWAALTWLAQQWKP